MSRHCFIESAIVLLTWGGLLGNKGSHRGIINKTVKFHKALKCLNCIFALMYMIYTHF